MLKELGADLALIKERDPAARGALEILCCYPGLHALTLHRLSHTLWLSNWPKAKLVARLISQLARWLTGIEIHPGAVIGKGVFIDHGMGVVIGETARIGDRCLLYQGVTLGGTGKAHGKRHPTIEDNVVIGAGAKILGAIRIGADTRVGAGSVVLRDVEPNSTVVGVPGRVVHQSGVKVDPLSHSELPDAEARIIRNLMERIDCLEDEVRHLNLALNSRAKQNDMNQSANGKAQSLRDKEIIDFLGLEQEPRES